MKFRDLNKDEIECRVATVNEKGCSLLLYKDARCDMNILDETLGVTGWRRSHEIIGGNLFCTVEVMMIKRRNGYTNRMWVLSPIRRKKKDKHRTVLNVHVLT